MIKMLDRFEVDPSAIMKPAKRTRRPKNWKPRYWLYSVREKRMNRILFVGLGNKTEVLEAWRDEYRFIKKNWYKHATSYRDAMPTSANGVTFTILDEFEFHDIALGYLENYERWYPYAICRDCSKRGKKLLGLEE